MRSVSIRQRDRRRSRWHPPKKQSQLAVHAQAGAKIGKKANGEANRVPAEQHVVLSKAVTTAPPTTALMRAMAVSTLVPLDSRSIRYEIQPITRSKKTAPSPAINTAFLLVCTR